MKNLQIEIKNKHKTTKYAECTKIAEFPAFLTFDLTPLQLIDRKKAKKTIEGYFDKSK
jgi:hypothetical protein